MIVAKKIENLKTLNNKDYYFSILKFKNYDYEKVIY